MGAMPDAPRQAMENALKQMIDAHLRPAGFSGSFPHLRRRLPNRIDLLSFQFHSAGGRFVVEVAQCGADGFTTRWGKHLPASKVTAQFVVNPPNRVRIGTDTFGTRDHWYSFGTRNYERPQALSSDYDTVAEQVLTDVRRQAEPFWNGEHPLSRNSSSGDSQFL